MIPINKKLSEAAHYVMPAIDDYLATRCLLLNSVFVGLITAHEAVEKLMKALLILEEQKIPKSCHKLTLLAKLLFEKDKVKYNFLKKKARMHFIEHLDQNYGWRYYDGNFKKRSKSRGISELHPIDNLWITLYECYMGFLPEEIKFANYLASHLFAPNMKNYLNWSELLTTDNRTLNKKKDWEENFNKWYFKKQK